MWDGSLPIGPNMLPLAAEMCDWLGRKSLDLSVCLESDRGRVGYSSNPYTYHASAIGVSLGAIVNSMFEFSEADDEIDALEAEVRRVRLQNELTLYFARFCEATIKQMLHCTQIPRRMYKRASLGQLLAVDCEACRKAEDKDRHDISLLGALAHQYFLCHTMDSCMADHLAFASARRNVEAAHAESNTLDPQGHMHSRARLRAALDTIGHELGHMTDHIGQIERRMIKEISLACRAYPEPPDPRTFSQIPARPRSERG